LLYTPKKDGIADEKLNRVFNYFDSNKNGSLDKSELFWLIYGINAILGRIVFLKILITILNLFLNTFNRR
jgi:hypothetical protein